MNLLGWLLFLVVGVAVTAAVVYVVWRVLDRRDVDDLRQQLDVLDRRLAAIEADRTRP
jgi:hypothetical protein